MRIVTWNINSIRIRLRVLKRMIGKLDPDVICLQELKCEDGVFPHAEMAKLGYPHALVRGLKSYNGVAILSKKKLDPGDARHMCGRPDSRHLVAQLPGGIELHNFYVPAGGDIPDPFNNVKFAHKLSFVSEMAHMFEMCPPGKRILVGDLNIAPLDTDVWSHSQLQTVVSHTPIEVEHLWKVKCSQSWVDAVRHFVPPDRKLYTWWSYRNRTWPGEDRGRRLDHVWVTPPLEGKLKSARVLREARGWNGTSDHVPVMVELAI